MIKSSIVVLIVFVLGLFLVIFSNWMWPKTEVSKTEVSMNIENFPYCFYFDNKRKITCYNKAVTTKYVKDAYHIVFEKANTSNEKGE